MKASCSVLGVTAAVTPGSTCSSRSYEQLLRSVGCAQNKGVGSVLLNTDSSEKKMIKPLTVLHI